MGWAAGLHIEDRARQTAGWQLGCVLGTACADGGRSVQGLLSVRRPLACTVHTPAGWGRPHQAPRHVQRAGPGLLVKWLVQRELRRFSPRRGGLCQARQASASTSSRECPSCQHGVSHKGQPVSTTSSDPSKPMRSSAATIRERPGDRRGSTTRRTIQWPDDHHRTSSHVPTLGECWGKLQQGSEALCPPLTCKEPWRACASPRGAHTAACTLSAVTHETGQEHPAFPTQGTVTNRNRCREGEWLGGVSWSSLAHPG